MNQKTDAAREKLAAPFSPVGGVDDYQRTHALNYIAYSLGEIEKHLKRLADHLAPEK